MNVLSGTANRSANACARAVLPRANRNVIDSGSITTTTGSTTRAGNAPSAYTHRHPTDSTSDMPSAPASAPPAWCAVISTVTARFFRAAGAYSMTMAMSEGSRPPSAMPATNRAPAKNATDGAKALAAAAREKTVTPVMMIFRRPT